MMAFKVLHPLRLALLLLLLKMSSSHPAVSPGNSQQLCSLGNDYGSSYSVLRCQDGIWPGSSAASLPFRDVIVDVLRIERLTVNSRDFQTLFSAKAKDLQMHAIETRDGITFPFRAFLRGLSKETVEQIDISTVRLGGISERDFEGFLSLKSLNIQDAGLQTIHPDAFQHFGTTSFGSLSISPEHALTSFPWTSLRSFTKTLKSFGIGGDQLAELNIQGSPQGMRFEALEYVFFSGSALKTIPQNVLDTFIYNHKGTPVHLTFAYNRNTCRETSSLASLVRWIKSAGNRADHLHATCNMEDGTVSQNSGSSQRWINCRQVICQN